ncbi:MFS family permease [Microbacterium terrae]|uniref:Enterobactin exporter EntS n=1 Tax=Microbacterium terrae TaxID=69369 RepID=A0A0M2H5V3_9MICO|nr:MFS transporter [Microbacterium terrae]KJL39225.1 enterobactin exporter EntS [Microbacterium terrae]MBP1076841.1 MFS family permease [Microbacterium terrae]GLJ99436.1 MFS transporter [Microbacterium terrae]
MPSLGEMIAPRRMGTDFRWLMSASWTSNLGDGIALAAAPLLIASLTSSPILVAAGAMMQFLPWLLFGLLAGAVADHHDRRRLVMLANGVRAVIVLALVGFLISGHATVWMVLATAFLYGTAEVFADSAGSTLLPMVVGPADLGIGNARMQAGYLVANQLAGPPLGAFLFALGSFWPFLLQVLCVALAVLLISRITRTPVPEHASADGTGSKTHAIREGLRWLRGNAPVRTLVIIILVFNVTWAAPWGVLVLYATEHLGMGPVGYGALTTASALGGFIAVFGFGWLEKHVSFATLMRVCLSCEVLMHLAFALTTSEWVAFVIMFGFGLYAFVWGTISTTVRQRLVPMELQGRIASVNMVGVFGGLVIGQFIGGVLAQTWGLTAPWWFAFAGSAITLLLVWRSISHIAAAKPVLGDEAVDDLPEEPGEGGRPLVD